jgi:hypothetical protein
MAWPMQVETPAFDWTDDAEAAREERHAVAD